MSFCANCQLRETKYNNIMLSQACLAKQLNYDYKKLQLYRCVQVLAISERLFVISWGLLCTVYVCVCVCLCVDSPGWPGVPSVRQMSPPLPPKSPHSISHPMGSPFVAGTHQSLVSRRSPPPISGLQLFQDQRTFSVAALRRRAWQHAEAIAAEAAAALALGIRGHRSGFSAAGVQCRSPIDRLWSAIIDLIINNLLL